MANYLLTSCDEVTQIVVNEGEATISVNNVYYITFTGETNPGCFTVTEESTDPIEDGINTAFMYNNCLECLQDNNWSFIVEVCDIPISGPVNANQFNEWPLGGYYKLCPPPDFVEELPECFCVNVIGISDDVIEPFFEIYGPFESCECVAPPRSANTETFVCLPDCDFTGTTATKVPHPVWTDAYGTPVTQLNMIVIGRGYNG